MTYNPSNSGWEQNQGWGDQPPVNQLSGQQQGVPFPSHYGGYQSPYQQQYQQQSQAATALWLGIGSLVSVAFCMFLAPFIGGVAWYLGHTEKKAIAAGLRDPGGAGQAMAGVIMGIIGIVIPVLLILLYVVALVLIGSSGGFD